MGYLSSVCSDYIHICKLLLIPYRLNDVVYNFIESVFCPLFHESEEVHIFTFLNLWYHK